MARATLRLVDTVTPVNGPVGGDAGGSTLLERSPALEQVQRAAARAARGSARVVALVGPGGSGRSALLAEVGDALAPGWSLRSSGAAAPHPPPRPVAVLVDDADHRPDHEMDALGDQLDAGDVDLAVLALSPGAAAGPGPVRRLLDRTGTAEVCVRPLTPAAVRALVVQALGHDDRDLAAAVHRRSGGLPALASALLDDPGDPVPAGAARRVRRLLDRLPDDARAVVELLAVAPGPVPVDVLEPATSRSALVTAHDAGLATVHDGTAQAHPPLVADVVLAELGSRHRERRQRELARCWMVHRDPCPATIATLLEQSGDRAGAAAFHVRAAEAALGRGDPHLAQAHFAEAQRGGIALDAPTLERAARAAASAGRPGRAERWARRAEAAHHAAGDADAAVRVWQHAELAYVRRTALGCVELDRGSPVRLANEAESAARRREPGACSLARVAAATARDAGDDDALNTAGIALLLAGAAAESRAVHDELRQRLLERGDAASEAAQLRALARVALATGDPLAALLHARAGVLAAEREPGTVVRAFQQIHLAALLTLTGDLGEAAALAEPLVDHPDPTVAAIAGIPLAGLALARDEPTAALALLAPLLPHRDAAGPDAFSGVLLQVAEAHVLLGDADRARATLDELDAFAGGTLEPTRSDALAIAGRLAADAGDRSGVVRALEGASTMAAEPGPGIVAVVELLEGLLRRIDGDAVAAAAHARAAAVTARRAPRARLAAAAWLDAADAALDAGDPAAAADALAEAEQLVRDRGLRAEQRRLDAVAARRGAASTPCDLPALTPRERSLLGLLTEGCTNRQMAERLHLSEKTVRNQLSTLFAKLDVERRSQAAVLGVQLGIAPPSP